VTEVTPGELAALLDAAREVRERAYAPYSGFRVGAAVLSDDGRTFPGVNVEIASYPVGGCAEEAAIQRAVTDGARRIVAAAVASSGAAPTWPCGACRQRLHEFGPGMLVVSEGRGGEPIARPLTELLPDAFGPSDLEA
jgi:cytidine deaminase